MSIIGGLLSMGAWLVCCGVLLVGLIVAGVLFYSSRQKPQSVSPAAPTPPVQTTIEHPTAATAQPPASPAAPTPPAPEGQQPDA